MKPSEMIIKNGERNQCERFHRYPFLTAPGQEWNDAMPKTALAADTEESNSEDEAVEQDGQDGQRQSDKRVTDSWRRYAPCIGHE